MKVTWGIGSQVETFFDFHLVGEIFSGAPYTIGSEGAFQSGFRQLFNPNLQLDFTCGSGLWGATILPGARAGSASSARSSSDACTLRGPALPLRPLSSPPSSLRRRTLPFFPEPGVVGRLRMAAPGGL